MARGAGWRAAVVGCLLVACGRGQGPEEALPAAPDEAVVAPEQSPTAGPPPVVETAPPPQQDPPPPDDPVPTTGVPLEPVAPSPSWKATFPADPAERVPLRDARPLVGCETEAAPAQRERVAERYVRPPSPESLEARPSLAPAACVPASSTPPVAAAGAHPCLVRALDAEGRLVRLQRFDAQGRLVLTRHYAQLEDARVEQAWEGERLVLQRRTDHDGSVVERRWVFGAQGRLEREDIHRQSFGQVSSGSVLYTYDAAGRPVRAAYVEGGRELSASVYTYDDAGRLLSVGPPEEYAGESFAYGADGSVWHRQWWPNGAEAWEQRDAAARLLAQGRSSGDGYASSTRLLRDAQGRVVREETEDDLKYGEGSTATVHAHDAEGRRLWTWRGTESANWFFGDETWLERSQRTDRFAYTCGTSLAVLQERDADADGRVDGRLATQRDAAGNVLQQQACGSAELERGILRVEYRYRCDAP